MEGCNISAAKGCEMVVEHHDGPFIIIFQEINRCLQIWT